MQSTSTFYRILRRGKGGALRPISAVYAASPPGRQQHEGRHQRNRKVNSGAQGHVVRLEHAEGNAGEAFPVPAGLDRRQTWSCNCLTSLSVVTKPRHSIRKCSIEPCGLFKQQWLVSINVNLYDSDLLAAKEGQYSFLRTERLQQCSYLILGCLAYPRRAQDLQHAVTRLTTQGDLRLTCALSAVPPKLPLPDQHRPHQHLTSKEGVAQ